MTATKDPAACVVPEISKQGAVYPLTPMDGNPTSRANLQFVFFYTLPADADRPKLASELRKAFYQTMAQYPILYGRIEEGDGSGPPQVHVTREYAATHGLPRYEEHQVAGAVAEIRAASYNWATWPRQLLSIRVARGREEEAPLAQCIATWFCDGLGLLFSVDHSIVDGIGVDILVNKWAQAARANRGGGAPVGPPVPVDFDHSSFYRAVCAEGPHDDWFVRHVDGLSADAAPVQGIVGHAEDPDAIEHALQDNVHVMRMTPEALAQLQRDHAPGVSAMRVAYALVWQRYMMAKHAGAEACLLNIIHSGRHLVRRPHYVGNAVCPTYMQASDLPAMHLRDVAKALRIHETATPQWLAFCLRMQDPRWFANFLTVFSSPQANQLTVSNISRLAFYDTDFGFGSPAHATLYPTLIPGFTAWMPLGPDGGLHILWNISPDALQTLAKDDVFCKYVDIVF
ncbi:hypothetical protein GGI23_003718 [Coemansia sp. RSA 2559]|nr:hypothetical protein GGI23_003718 [Coemansia sp. RSA 2559]KAJ2853907.1 hypothetical protein GGI22_004685 [Coemansia erecta]